MVVATQPIPLNKKDALRHLEKTSPETLALANDWEDIAAKVVHTQEKIKECVIEFYPCLPDIDLRAYRLFLSTE